MTGAIVQVLLLLLRPLLQALIPELIDRASDSAQTGEVDEALRDRLVDRIRADL